MPDEIPEKSTEESSQEVNKKEKPSPEKVKTNPIQKWTIRILILAFLYFIWYLVSDRVTPMTNQARVRGYLVPVASQVSGEIIEVAVGMNEIVEFGQTIVRINPKDFELAVQEAEAELESAGQELGAGTAGIAAAQASVIAAESSFNSIKANSARVFELVEVGNLPRSDGDKAQGLLGEAEARVMSAEAELVQAKQQLGVEGEANPRIRTAMAHLDDVRLDLERTVIRAPIDGGVTNMNLEVGLFASAGAPLFTFVSTRTVWVEAYMRENNISNIKPGDKVEMVLDVAPGKIFNGEVASIGFGVNWNQGSTRPGDLPIIQKSTGWMGEPQRFPVIIQFSDESSVGFRREGGQANVIIYTDDNTILNMLGSLSIRIRSILSYLN